jgi:[ribosomal protein S5]-alanine N-acetyltransferase
MGEFPILSTERLLLRNFDENDADALFNYFSKVEMTQYYGMSSFKSREEAEKLVQAFQHSFAKKEGIRWAIVNKQTNELIGTCGFHNWSKAYKRAEVGYEISSKHWRKGYASEALIKIIQYAFEDLALERIGAVVMPENKASRLMLTNLGFSEEGLLRNYIVQDNKMRDTYMYSLLKQEFPLKKPLNV